MRSGLNTFRSWFHGFRSASVAFRRFGSGSRNVLSGPASGLALGFAIVLFSLPFQSNQLWAASDAVKAFEIAAGRDPSIASARGVLHVVFEKGDTISYTRSSDNGKSWSTPAKISHGEVACCLPEIASSRDGTINIVWQAKAAKGKPTGVYFVRSTDGGDSFSDPMDVTNTSAESTEPHIAIGSDDSIHIVWIDALPAPQGPDVFHSASHDGGKTWSKYNDVSNTPGGTSSNPCIAVGSDGKVHVSWVDTSSGATKPDIFYVQKMDGHWGVAQDISHDAGICSHPHIGCGPKGKVYITWVDNSKKETAADIWCVEVRPPNRITKPINISKTRGVCSQPALSVDQSNRVAIVWADTSRTMQVSDIWARTGYDADFAEGERLCSTPRPSLHPSVTVANKKAFVVWEDEDGPDSKVYSCSLDIVRLFRSSL